jgi:flagellar protein FlgJ
MSAIKSSVGLGKPNSHDDVLTIQRLLNQHIGQLTPLARLQEDGRFGSATASAIVQYQQRVLHVAAPDGVVDPNGATLRSLSGGAATHSPPPYVSAFINMALPVARNVKTKWGVPIAVTIAQSAQETGWGRKVVHNAFFGIKGHAPDGSSTKFGTTEVVNGKVIHIQAQFRAYTDYADAADDYGRLLSGDSRYQGAFAYKHAPLKFVEEIARAGYATDPNYAKDLKSIISSNHLDQYDQ